MRRGNVVGDVVLPLRGVVAGEYRSRRWCVRDIRR